MKTLLVIFAHPDDELHGPGGTLAKYAGEGVKVHYLCATRGEAGMVDREFLQRYSNIAELRTIELQRAADELGLASVDFLNYRDSGMEGSVENQHPDSLYMAPLDDVAGQIAEAICRLRPDAIITHDQYGWYGHPDHIKCYQATLRAYEMLYGMKFSADGQINDLEAEHYLAPRLYISSFSKWPLKVLVAAMRLMRRDPRRHGQNQDVDLVKIASWNIRLTTRISIGDYLPVKERAIRCHASQKPLADSRNSLVCAVMRRIESVEGFSRLYPPVGKDEASETTLFGKAEEMQWQPALEARSLA